MTDTGLGKEIQSSLICDEKKEKDWKPLIPKKLKNVKSNASSDPSSEEQINTRVKNQLAGIHKEETIADFQKLSKVPVVT